MAKPLGAKSLLIRDAIKAHPDKGNTELADAINASPARTEDKIEVTSNDIAQQRQALKKLGEAPEPEAAPAAEKAAAPAKKRGRPAGKPAKKTPATAKATAPANGPVALIDGVFTLAGQCGGMGELKRLVERLSEARGQ